MPALSPRPATFHWARLAPTGEKGGFSSIQRTSRWMPRGELYLMAQTPKRRFQSAMAQNLSLRTPHWQQVLTLVPPACQAFSPEFARISPETNWGCSYLWSALVLITGSLDSVPDSVAAPAQAWPSRSLSGNNASRGTIADETFPGRLSR